MKSILFITLACSQAMLASPGVTYEGAEYGYQQPHSRSIANPELQKRNIAKTYKVAAVSAGTLMIASIYCSAIYTFGGNLGMAATLAGVSTAGVATYAYFSLKDD